MKKALTLLFLAVSFIAATSFAESQKRKDIVLMPMGGAFGGVGEGTIAKAVSDGLGEKYRLIWGAQVDEYVKKVFKEENQKLDCDLENCYAKIAQHFNTEMVAVVQVVKKSEKSGELIFKTANVLEGKVVFERKAECDNCTPEKAAGAIKSMLAGKK